MSTVTYEAPMLPLFAPEATAPVVVLSAPAEIITPDVADVHFHAAGMIGLLDTVADINQLTGLVAAAQGEKQYDRLAARNGGEEGLAHMVAEAQAKISGLKPMLRPTFLGVYFAGAALPTGAAIPNDALQSWSRFARTHIGTGKDQIAARNKLRHNLQKLIAPAE